MFRTIASLLLFGVLSPVSTPQAQILLPQLLDVASLSPVSTFSVGEEFTASGAIVIDVESGRELFALAADERRPIGSLAKLMTAVVILEHHELSEVVVVPKSVVGVGGHIAGLNPGERFAVRDLLAALLIASANDAAHTLAIYHSGSTALFADVMNERAGALGMRKTHFDNPVGFDSADQLSTPRELAWLSLYALKQDIVRSLVSQKAATIRDRASGRTVDLRSTNNLLFSHPTTFFGLKTGTTEDAGECLIALTYVHDRPYLFIILRSADRYRDTLHLLTSLSQEHV